MVLGSDDPLRKELNERASSLRMELEALTREIEGLNARRSEKVELLEHIEALLGVQPGPISNFSLTEPVSTDESIADMVVSLLKEAGKPLHYREIYDSLSRAGRVEMAGKDPANSLLARYFKDERLYRPARGTYALKTSSKAVSVGSRATGRKSRARRSR